MTCQNKKNRLLVLSIDEEAIKEIFIKGVKDRIIFYFFSIKDG